MKFKCNNTIMWSIVAVVVVVFVVGVQAWNKYTIGHPQTAVAVPNVGTK